MYSLQAQQHERSCCINSQLVAREQESSKLKAEMHKQCINIGLNIQYYTFNIQYYTLNIQYYTFI